MSDTMMKLPDDHPLVVAFAAYKGSEGYANTRQWAQHESAVDGSLWAAFSAGYAHSEALRLQLSRTKEWMQHASDCVRIDRSQSFGGQMVNSCTCGLQAFIEEVGE